MYIMSVKHISDNKTESLWNPDISVPVFQQDILKLVQILVYY